MQKQINHYINIDVIKGIMEEKGIDDKKLAALIKVTPPTIKKLLDGADQSNLSGGLMYKIAKALEVAADSLLHEKYRHHKNN